MPYSDEKKILAIDLGSNAMRASIACFDSSKDLEIIQSMRYPLRLGEDVFSKGKLSKASFKKATGAFMELKNIIKAQNITDVKAVATSALRDSENGAEFVDYILEKTGIKIEVIDGDQEAKLIKQAVSSVIDLKGKTSLLIDIGGGSTEFTLTQNNKILFTKSYQCGTVRLLDQSCSDELNTLITTTVKQAYKEISSILGNKKIDLCIGTGGNLKRMGKLRKIFFKRSAHKVTQQELAAISSEVSKLSLEHRMSFFSMRQDRADVIVPAIQIIELMLIKFDLREILLPTVGLKEGVMVDHFGETPRNIIMN